MPDCSGKVANAECPCALCTQSTAWQWTPLVGESCTIGAGWSEKAAAWNQGWQLLDFLMLDIQYVKM
jgi:hypothetical protein